MRYFKDREIRKAILKEKWEFPQDFDRNVQKKLNELCNCDINMLEEKYQTGNNRFIKRKRTAVLATVAMVAVLLMGAGVMREYRTIDIWGNCTIIQKSISNSEDIDYDAFYDYHDKNVEYGEFLKVSSIYIVTAIESWNEIPDNVDIYKLIEEANLDFQIPEKIRENCSLKRAKVRFYLKEEEVQSSKLLKTESKGEYVYQIFSYPDGFEKNIQAIYLEYEDADGKIFGITEQLTNNTITSLTEKEDKITPLEKKGFTMANLVETENYWQAIMAQEVDNVPMPEPDVTKIGKEECFACIDEHFIKLVASKFKLMYEPYEAKDESNEEDKELCEQLTNYNILFYQITTKDKTMSEKDLKKVVDQFQ